MSVPKRFAILRFVGNLFKILAWILLIISILGAIGLAILGSSAGAGVVTQFIPEGVAANFGGAAGGVLGGILLLIFGLVYFLIFYAAGENLHLRLAVEENTRLTAALLLRMHQDSQMEQNASYGAAAGFASEPFEG